MEQAMADASNPSGVQLFHNHYISGLPDGHYGKFHTLSFLNPSFLKLNTSLTYFTQSQFFPLTCSVGLCSFLQTADKG